VIKYTVNMKMKYWLSIVIKLVLVIFEIPCWLAPFKS